jgi:hypothetical protein
MAPWPSIPPTQWYRILQETLDDPTHPTESSFHQSNGLDPGKNPGSYLRNQGIIVDRCFGTSLDHRIWGSGCLQQMSASIVGSSCLNLRHRVWVQLHVPTDGVMTRI